MIMHKSSVVTIFCLIVSSVVECRLSRITKAKNSIPEEAGAYHTDAFEILGKLYSKRKPRRKLDAMMDISNILVGYCPLDDAECTSKVYQTTKEQFELARTRSSNEIKLPSSVDERIKSSINDMVSSVRSINELNLDEVIQSLNGVQDELIDMTGVDPAHQFASLAGLSVAIESSMLWHATYFDTYHPLHHMIHHFSPDLKHRKTQSVLELAALILADVTAAVESGFIEILIDGKGVSGLLNIIIPSVAASGAEFFESGLYYDDDGYYYGDDDNEKDIDDDVFDEQFDDFYCQITGQIIGCEQDDV